MMKAVETQEFVQIFKEANELYMSGDGLPDDVLVTLVKTYSVLYNLTNALGPEFALFRNEIARRRDQCVYYQDARKEG